MSHNASLWIAVSGALTCPPLDSRLGDKESELSFDDSEHMRPPEKSLSGPPRTAPRNPPGPPDTHEAC